MLQLIMTKKEAINLISGNKRPTQVALAQAVGVTKQAIWFWDDILNESQANQVLGAAIRLGITIPDELLRKPKPRNHKTPTKKVTTAGNELFYN